MFGAIIFAIKIVFAAFLVIPLFLSKNLAIPRDKVAIYSVISIISAALTALSIKVGSGFIAASLFVAIGIVSYSQFKKEDQWMDVLQTIAPFWLVSVIGICVGAGMIIQAIILVGVSYYIVNYLPILLTKEKRVKEENN